ncbi:hypothetical protein EHT25_30130 [Larkinella rosea]|uniref:DUF4595 domain-containing protein n=2 Tax=Larkinella rosea TaxID=2025312 RepID=A0A3P1BDR0_9BACT|nr:hypothetical protein EHT25_30130 [Larkinella rosea]
MLTVDSKTSGPDAYSRDETVMLDGQTIKIGKTATDVYKFDEQNRIIESSWATYNYGGNGGKEKFEYTADQVIITSTHLGMDNGVHPLPLNKQGLLLWDGLKYDAEGFLIEKVEGNDTITYTIENGNIVREERKTTLPVARTYVSLYEYDLTKPNLPNSHPYSGKVSKNLLVKVTTTDGTNMTGSYSYSYLFDESKGLTRKYQKLSNGYYVVYDYTITCR